MQLGFGMHGSAGLAPTKSGPAGPPPRPQFPAGFHLVVLKTHRIRKGLDETVVNQWRVGNALQFLDHPPQRDVRQSRLAFGIAPTDVRVVAGEPFLLQPRQIAAALLAGVVAVAPADAWKALAVFVDRDGMPRVTDAAVEEAVVVLQVPCREVPAETASLRRIGDALELLLEGLEAGKSSARMISWSRLRIAANAAAR